MQWGMAWRCGVEYAMGYGVEVWSERAMGNDLEVWSECAMGYME